MIEHSRRLVAQAAGFATAVVIATAFATPSHGRAASPDVAKNTPATAGEAVVGWTSLRPSMVVHPDDGDQIDPDVRHHWPNLDGDDRLGPLVRHHWP